MIQSKRIVSFFYNNKGHCYLSKDYSFQKDKCSLEGFPISIG